MHSPDEKQPSCPGRSLWSLIREHVSESELLKVCAALDQSLVDKYTEVHSEAQMWHKTWQDSQRSGNHGSRAETPFTCLQGSPLSDPPAVKELVRAEVKMLLQALKEKARSGGRHEEEFLFQYKPETVHYALGHQETRYSSFLNSEDADNARSRPSSRCSVQSMAEDEIEAIRDKLIGSEIHKVTAQLRSVLLAECDALTAMVKYFKRNIKQKRQNGSELNQPEPSLIELRELRAAIQMDLKHLPSSPGASTSPPVKGRKNSFRLSAGQRPDSHSLCNLKPRPPSPHLPPKTSLSRIHGQHGLTSASNKTSRPRFCSRMASSECTNNLRISKSKTPCSLSTERDLFWCPLQNVDTKSTKLTLP